MSTHLSFRIARPLHRKCIIARSFPAMRPFSSSSPRQRQNPGQGESGTDKDQKAPSTLEKEAMANQRDLREDIGLLPGTFIRARGFAPRLLDWSDRWKYEWQWAKTKFRDWYSIKYYVWWLKDGKWSWKLKPKNGKFKARQDGAEHYEKLYVAFAKKDEALKNDEALLKKFCLEGLREHFKERWATRPSDVTMSWKLLQWQYFPPSIAKYFSPRVIEYFSARIISNRMAYLPIPGANDRESPSAVRQVILRIASRQELNVLRDVDVNEKGEKAEKLSKLAWRPEGAKVEAPTELKLEKPMVKDVVEYMVLQRRMLKGKEEDWKVWGFVEPTTLETMRKTEELEAQSKAYTSVQLGVA